MSTSEACYTLIPLEQGSKEWLEFRMKFITASQVPMVLGISPYQTALQLFEEKVFGRKQDNAGKEVLFARGHSAEAAGRAHIEKTLNVRFEPCVMVSRQNPMLMASLDGWCAERRVIYEAKFVSREVRAAIEAEGEAGIPDFHMAQMQAALFVSGAVSCLYFATDPDGASVLVEVKPNAELISVINTSVAKFVVEHIQPKIAPPLSERDWFVPPPDTRFFEVALLDTHVKELTTKLEKLKSELKDTYRHHPRVRRDGVSITRSVREGAVDYKKIPELKGVDLEKYRKKPTEVVTIRVTKPGEELGEEGAA